MVLPISGPLVQEQIDTIPEGNQGFRTQVYWNRIERYRQQKPYDRPLNYVRRHAHVVYESNNGSYSHYYQTEAYRKCFTSTWTNWYLADAYNKAYARLLSKIKSDTAELGAALAEYRKTADMVSDRSYQLLRFVRAVKRGRFGEANDLLRVPKGFRPKAKSLGGAVLEYSFGWAPTVNDIHNGMKVLANGCPDTWARARVKNSFPQYTLRSGSSPTLYTETCEGKVVVTVGACVRLSNPNLWLLNQLGLINPVSIAWELVPFSFLVDYVGNIGDVVNSWTDTMGLTLRGVYRSFSLETESLWYQEYGNFPAPRTGRAYLRSRGNAYRFEREVPGSLPGPSLRFASPTVSLRRATTSIALLLQLLKGK